MHTREPAQMCVSVPVCAHTWMCTDVCVPMCECTCVCAHMPAGCVRVCNCARTQVDVCAIAHVGAILPRTLFVQHVSVPLSPP